MFGKSRILTFSQGWITPVERRNAVLLVALAEDMGDAADIAIASLSGGESRPLIQGVPGVCEIMVSSDGGYVTFLKEDDPSALYVISTTQPEAVARRILVAETALGGAADPDADPDLLVEVACLAGPAEGVQWR